MSDDPRSDELSQLLELQRIDSRIARLEHVLDELPEQQQLDEIEQERRAVGEQQDARELDLERANAELRKLEREVDQLGQRREAEQVRMYGGEISNAKELQSLRAEISSIERRIGEHEDAMLEVMERVETAEIGAARLAEQAKDLDERIAELTAARDDAAASHLAERGELKVARDRQREVVPVDLLERYDAVRDRLGGGVAVGELRDGMCTACRIEMPLAEARQLRSGPPLTTCPQCRRLLVVDV